MWDTTLGRGLALLAALTLGACGGEPSGPPEVLYGADVCDHCRMIVSDERHAAAARGPEGEVARFDDLGCLLAHRAARQDEGWTTWVHDFENRKWLRAEEAWLVRTSEIETPMGSGWAAFRSRTAAESYGEALRVDEAVNGASGSGGEEGGEAS